MPTSNLRFGRLIPASEIEFSRSTKHLAWLTGFPLHIAQDILAKCYGFGSVHELRAAIPPIGDSTSPTGPYAPPRLRPYYFQAPGFPNSSDPNRLIPLSLRERKLIDLIFESGRDRWDVGSAKRRWYSALDAAFFSPPSVHRKHFASVKSAILAMEGNDEEREEFLEGSWPPGFWSYLEYTHQLDFDARPALKKLKTTSLFNAVGEIESIEHLFQKTAAYRAPSIFLEMAGHDPLIIREGMPSYEQYFIDSEIVPSISNSRPGLFDCDYEDWWETLVSFNGTMSEDLVAELQEMLPEEISNSPPEGTPQELIGIAKGWRLHQLRKLSENYQNDSYKNRHLACLYQAFWPYDESEKDLQPVDGESIIESIERSNKRNLRGKFLNLYAEFSDAERVSSQEANRKICSFQSLITKRLPNEPEEVIGCMTGWIVDPRGDGYVTDAEDLSISSWYIDRMLGLGVDAFLKSYLPFDGSADLLEHVNSRWLTSFVVTEIALLEKYRGQNLLPLSLGNLHMMFSDGLGVGYPEFWREAANFDRDGPIDIGELEDHEDDFDILPPGVFLIPTRRRDKALRRHLMSLDPEIDDPLDGNTTVEIFPFIMPDEDTDQTVQLR